MEDLPETLVEGYAEAKTDEEKKQLDQGELFIFRFCPITLSINPACLQPCTTSLSSSSTLRRLTCKSHTFDLVSREAHVVPCEIVSISVLNPTFVPSGFARTSNGKKKELYPKL